MANYSDYWLRLEQVILWAEMSVNFFAYHIGLSRPDVIYRIKSGRIGLSQSLARRVVEKFPEVSLGWLLSGEGSMLVTDENRDEGAVPYYDCGVAEAIRLFNEGAKSPMTLHLPLIGECDCAARSYDEAMAEEIAPGSVVFLKKTDIKTVVPGGVYVVVCSNFVLLRRVRIEPTSEMGDLILEPANKSFDRLSVAAADVVEIFKLVGTLRLH